MKSFSILHFQLLAILLRQLLADKLSCGTRRTSVTAQREALCKQVQLVDIKVQSFSLASCSTMYRYSSLSGTEKVISRPKRSDSEVTVSRVSRTRTSSP